MQPSLDSKPNPDEYAAHYKPYISLVGPGDITGVLVQQIGKTRELLDSIPEQRSSFRYAPDKWSIAEVVGHLIDTERVMAFRALAFARGDKSDIAGMDQDQYVAEAGYDACQLTRLVNEFESLRNANASFFGNLNEQSWSRGGKASGNYVTVRALAYIIAGHELHHIKIVKERYLEAPGFGA